MISFKNRKTKRHGAGRVNYIIDCNIYRFFYAVIIAALSPFLYLPGFVYDIKRPLQTVFWIRKAAIDQIIFVKKYIQ